MAAADSRHNLKTKSEAQRTKQASYLLAMRLGDSACGYVRKEEGGPIDVNRLSLSIFISGTKVVEP
jgi:hypothetical protein